MAVSGSQDYTQNRDEIIKDSLMLLGAIHEDEAVHQSTENFAARMLNKMIKAWNAQGLHLWGFGEGAIVLDKDTIKYTIKTSLDTNVVKADGFIKAEFGAAEAEAQTSITVDSSAGMAASDVIFLELDDGTLDETTISSVTDSTTIVIASGLSSAATSGNHIYVYTSAADSLTGVKQITNVRVRDSNGNDRELTRLSREEYNQIHNKTSEAVPIGYFVDYQRDNPVLYIWPEPDSRKDYIRFTYIKSIDDFDASTDNPDFPQEWLEAITYNLAVRLAPALGKEAKLQILVPMAIQFLEEMKAWDDEPADVFMRPEMD